MKPLRVLVAAAALLAAAVFLPSIARAGTALETYKVLAYNVAGVDVPLLNPSGKHFAQMDIDARGHAIASFILGGGYDIVALEEAWDNPFGGSLKDELSADLTPTYPFHFDVIAGPGLALMDSGLMIFSKFPFVKVPALAGQTCALESEQQSGLCTTAFHRYSNTFAEDALAGKGVGFVRVQNPATGSQTNVFFTHMQADPDTLSTCVPCAVSTRAGQMGEIVSFVNAWAPAGDTARETLFVGDLNIRHAIGGVPTAEYNAQLSPTGTLGALGFEDAWTETSSKDQFGTMVDDPSAKLDYVMFRPPAVPATTVGRRFCVQHETLEHQFFVDDSTHHLDPSDHRPYAAVIAPRAPRCSPATALANPGNGTVAGSIDHAGGFQWYRFDTGGTYEFSIVGGGPMQVTAFAQDDLTDPLAPAEGSGTMNGLTGRRQSVVFAEPKGFFLRVRSDPTKAPLFTGAYGLNVLRHDGHSFATAIRIDPSTPTLALAPAVTQSPQPVVYYLFRMHAPDDPAATPRESFTTASNQLLVSLDVFDRPKVDAGLQPAPLASTFPAFQSQIKLPLGGIALPKAGEFYLRVTNWTPNVSGFVTTTWRTSVFQVHLDTLEIVSQNDTLVGESDEPGAFLTQDMLPMVDAQLGEVDSGTNNQHFPMPFGQNDPPRFVNDELDLKVYQSDNSFDCVADPDSCVFFTWRDPNGGEHEKLQIAPWNTGVTTVDPTPIGAIFDASEGSGVYIVHYRAWTRIHN